MSKTEAPLDKYWARWREPFMRLCINSFILAFIHSFTYTLNKYTLSVYYMLGSEDPAVIKTDKFFNLKFSEDKLWSLLCIEW